MSRTDEIMALVDAYAMSFDNLPEADDDYAKLRAAVEALEADAAQLRAALKGALPALEFRADNYANCDAPLEAALAALGEQP